MNHEKTNLDNNKQEILYLLLEQCEERTKYKCLYSGFEISPAEIKLISRKRVNTIIIIVLKSLLNNS